MDCQNIEFSAEKSAARINGALAVFSHKALNKILAFALHLLGAKRRGIASLLGMSQESAKTSIRVLLRDGFPALRDRRFSDDGHVPTMATRSFEVSIRQEKEWHVVDFGVPGKELRIPTAHKIQLRAVLLSLLNSGLLSVQDTASALEISEAHCRELANKLESMDVAKSLIDKRQGQKQDYLVGPVEKAELIQQFAARAVVGQSVSSEKLTEILNELTETTVSARAIRWHMNKLGLREIKKTLPALVDDLKKTRKPAS